MKRRLHYVLGQALVRVFAHLVLGYAVRGTEQIPRAGPFLLAANHKSYFDPPFAGGSLKRELRYFAKRQLFEIPIFAGLIRAFGAIPVDRDAADRRAVSAALAILEAGEGLLVFPEGTRIRRPGLAEPKAGIGLLAVRSGAPVIPVYIASSWEPRRRWWRRIPVRLRYGPPLRFERGPSGPAARESYAEAAQAIMTAIAALAPEGESLDPAPGAERTT
jgi:1-acyl-sn-glycerol-3-phosphate acyltransferase